MSMEPITSLQNQRVKNAIKLRNARDRKSQGRFVIDGLREIGHALAGDIKFDEVFVCQSLCQSDTAIELLNQLENSANILSVNEKVWDKLTFGNRQDGLLVTAKTPERRLDAIPLDEDSLIVILQSVEKPGNVGAVLRSADGAGATAVVVADPVSDLYNPNAIRASLGTIFRMSIAVGTSTEVLAWIRQNALPTFVTTVGAEVDYVQADYRKGCAIVLGSEAHGVSDEWRSGDLNAIGLPMQGFADSLNISASAAVVLYEANRQRRA